MKSKYILAIGYLAALSFSSCGDDFLGKEPQGALTPDALANPTGVELLTVSAYAGLAVPWMVMILIKHLHLTGYGVVFMVVTPIKVPTRVTNPW